ncbi:MAG: phosphatidylinositol mannoside acyltransferase [Acidimicrobiales bacterium]
MSGLTGMGVYAGYRAAAFVARALPAPATGPVADTAARVMARMMRGRRAMVERHLRRVHGPDLAGARLAEEVRRTFASYARYWVEAFRLPGTTPAQLEAGMSWEGLEHVERGVAAGNGVILALPHLGSWDFGGAWMASRGYRMVAVTEPLAPERLFRWFADLRLGVGMEIVPLGPAAGPTTLRRLKEGAVLALVCDRDLGGTGVEVEFFGEHTTLPGGPATIALRTGAVLVPSAVYDRPDGGHHAVMGPPIDATRRGRLRDDVLRVTQELAHRMEDSIRQAPEQWHLLQPNWPSDRDAVGRTAGGVPRRH